MKTTRQPTRSKKPVRLRIYRGSDEPEPRNEDVLRFEQRDEPVVFLIEDYWAGRNRAMRLSARAAA